MKACTVSFSDPDGIRHVADVQADSLFEAVAIAVRAFRLNECKPAMNSKFEVQVREPSVVHVVTLRKVEEFIDGPCKSPKEKLVKERLRGFLTG